ncbi:MAG: dihydroorotate dehydrogenase electron transfer subunit [Gammaproteobacteria bacterium]|nr:dihydroorotate dehydrogenase electron transfer subunit [Gammaproteobacteria bacterium]
MFHFKSSDPLKNNKQHRDSIFVEDAEILSHQGFAGDQYVIRLQAPECARHAHAGSFVHIRCAERLPMRRPLSLLRCDPQAGWIEILYKALGEGTRELTQRKPGEQLSVMGPIGKPFKPSEGRDLPVLIGGGVGMPPMIFLALEMKQHDTHQPLVVMGSEVPFPFKIIPSSIMVPGLPDGVIAAMPMLDDKDIASRLCSLQDYAGCHQGYVTDLVRLWLEQLDNSEHQRVEFFACGPHAMLEAVARLAREYDLPCQVSLEEHMACAVGGCAGCTVPITTKEGVAMKRVCVDGPVFDAYEVFSE